MAGIDLHTHSVYSVDGELPPADLIKRAKEKGLTALALTDHNTMAGLPEAQVAGIKYQLEVIPGIEIDTKYQERGVHILGYFLDPQNQELFDLLKQMRDKYFELARQRVQRLRELGFEITYEEAVQAAKDIPIGGVLAEVIINNGKNLDHPYLQDYLPGGARSGQPYFNFHLDFFSRGKKAYIPFDNVPASKVIKIIRKSGGVAVLAHPGSAFAYHKEEDIQGIKGLVELGLQGIEAYSTYHDPLTMEAFAKLGKELKLLVTAGSDFHGRYKPEIELGGIPHNEEEILVKLKALRGGV